MAFPSDLDIARSVHPRPIADVAHDLGLRDDEIELYGELVIAASASEQPLSPAEIDRVLGLRRAGAERDARNLLPPA